VSKNVPVISDPVAVKHAVISLVSGIEPADDLGRQHRRDTLAWLAGTDDIFRRARPGTPSPHLVSYFLPVDRPAASVLLGDHRLSGLQLPPGGHAEPGEHPYGTVRRECAEELGVAAQPDAVWGDRPFFLTVTGTAGNLVMRHTDVCLWFALAGRTGQALHPDPREFAGVRWRTAAELHQACAAGPGRFEPHLLRALTALGLREAVLCRGACRPKKAPHERETARGH
jgi:8-oxo-dGTP diphosphatase